MLSASLESWHFSSQHGFEFGARSRDYGYAPRIREDVQSWFKLYIEYTVSLATSETPVASQAKILLAEKFRGLWTRAGMHDALEFAAEKLSSKGTWREGWVAVRTTKKFDQTRMDSNVLSRLNNLDVILKPLTLIERARLYALARHGHIWVDDNENGDAQTIDDYHQAEIITRSIGREVASQDDILNELLPDILSNEGTRLASFG